MIIHVHVLFLCAVPKGTCWGSANSVPVVIMLFGGLQLVVPFACKADLGNRPSDVLPLRSLPCSILNRSDSPFIQALKCPLMCDGAPGDQRRFKKAVRSIGFEILCVRRNQHRWGFLFLYLRSPGGGYFGCCGAVRITSASRRQATLRPRSGLSRL